MKPWETLFKEEDFIKDLKSLLSIPSVKDVHATNERAPFGGDIQKALEFMLMKGNEEGLTTFQNDGFYGYIEYGPKDAKDYIAVLCHVDVVPASGKWTKDAFEPYIKNRKIYARGAIDDKGPTMAAWYALKLLKEAGYSLKHRIRLIIGTDEESGMRCMQSYVKNEPDALFGFAPDAQFPIIHAEKGQINLQLKCKPKHSTNSFQLVSFDAGQKGNMVPDQATVIIKGIISQKHKKVFKIMEQTYENLTVEKKDNDTYSLQMKGVSAHGMEPHKGENAAFSLVSLLLSVEELQIHPYLTFIYTYLKNDFNGKNLGIDFEDNVSGKLTVNAGVFHYDNQAGGEVSLNIRCPIDTPYEKTIDQIKALAKQKGWMVAGLRSKDPHYVEAKHEGVQALQEAYKYITKNESILLSTGGATYARFLANGVAFGSVFPGKINTAHQVDEYAEIEDLKKATYIYAEALYRLGNL